MFCSPSRHYSKPVSFEYFLTEVIASAKRHLAAIESGEDFDYDPNCEGCINGNCKQHSGLLHISHLQANAHFLNAYYYIYPQGDNRKKLNLNLPKIALEIDEVVADWVGGWQEMFNLEKRPTSWFFDRHIMDKFNHLIKNNMLDDSCIMPGQHFLLNKKVLTAQF